MNCNTCAEKFKRLKDLLKHISKNTYCYCKSNFFCTPCTTTLLSITDVVQHLESEEHSITSLATDVRFDVQDGNPDTVCVPFPPLNCCLLCSSRDSNFYDQHLSSYTHKKTTSLLRTIIRSKKLYCSEFQTSLTREFISKIIDIKRLEQTDGIQASDSLPLVCELCNIYFNKDEFYKQHLRDFSHERMEQFRIKLSHILENVEIIGGESYTTVSDTFSSSLPPAYHCGFCSVWAQKTPSFVQHTQSIIHRRIEELSMKLSSKIEVDAVSLPLHLPASVSHLNRYLRYCTLCTVWASGDTDHHYMDIGHQRIEHFVNSLCMDDKKLLRIYIEAQAHMKFNNTLPPDYCESCNILYSKSEKYEQHLQSEDHREIERRYLKRKENASKMLKGSPTKRNHPYCSVGRFPKNEQPIIEEKDIPCSSLETNSSFLHQLDFKEGEIERNSPQPCLEDNEVQDESISHEHYCELCDFRSHNCLQYDKHLMGNDHKRMRRMLGKKRKEPCINAQASETSTNPHPLQYKCELCDIFNNSYQEYEFHLNNAKHKRNQWLLHVLKQKSN